MSEGLRKTMSWCWLWYVFPDDLESAGFSDRCLYNHPKLSLFMSGPGSGSVTVRDS